MLKKPLLLVVLTTVMTLFVASAAMAAPPQWVMEKQLNKKAQKFEMNKKFSHQYYKQLQKMAKWRLGNGFPYQKFCYPLNRGELFPGELNQSEDVYVDTEELTIQFNDDIEPVGDLEDVLAGITIINLLDNESVVVEDIDINDNELTIIPEESLDYGTKYVIRIDANMLEDEDGHNFGVLNWYFATGTEDEERLSVESLQPNYNEHNVDVDIDELVVNFNQDIQPIKDLDDVLDGIIVTNLTDDEDLEIDEINIDGNELVIELEDELEYDSRYKIEIDEDILENEDGTNFDDFNWYFTTETDREEELSIESLEPNNYEHNVDVDIDELVVNFNQDIQPVKDLDDVLDGITVTNLTDDEELEIDEINIDGNELVIELEDELEYDCRYKVELDEDILENEDSNNFDDFSWRFTTEDE